VPVAVPLVGTVKDTIEALLPLLTAKSDAEHLDRMTAHYRRARSRLDKLAEARPGSSPLHPQFVAATIDRLAAADAVFTADVGTPCIWTARYVRMNGSRRLIGSFNHGSMANALPQAIGAQAAQPGRQVITLSGDGGLAMLLGELLTLRQQHLPAKVVVFNNERRPVLRGAGDEGGRDRHLRHRPGQPGLRRDRPGRRAVRRGVEKAGELEDALRAAFSHDGAALVDVRTDRHELSLPPKLTYGEVKRFTLYATRTVLSGEAKELVELAKTNLRELDIE